MNQKTLNETKALARTGRKAKRKDISPRKICLQESNTLRKGHKKAGRK